MKDLKPIRAVKLLQKLIDEGEHVTQDFKFTVNDPRKIARTLSAFANNSGGRLLIGVDDNRKIKGVRNEEDIYVVESAASVYCYPECRIEFTAYKATGGALVIRAEVAKSTSPVYVREADGELKAYYRQADENISAEPLMVKAWQYVQRRKDGIAMTMDPDRIAVLNSLGDNGMTFSDLSRIVSMSSGRLEETVIELYALGLIEFVYRNKVLYICCVSEDKL